MRACPYCAESIQEAAVLCKHCKTWLGEGPPPLGIAPPPVHLLAASPPPPVPSVPLAAPRASAQEPRRPAPAPPRPVPTAYYHYEPPEPKGSVGAAIGWMFLLSLLLCWLPILGPLIAGLVGGKKAGGVGKAILAVLLPAIVFGAILLAGASALSGMAIVGAAVGIGGVALALAGTGPLLIGAILGGLFA